MPAGATPESLGFVPLPVRAGDLVLIHGQVRACVRALVRACVRKCVRKWAREGGMAELFSGVLDAVRDAFLHAHVHAHHVLTYIVACGQVDHLSLPNTSGKSRHTFQLHLVEGEAAGPKWHPKNWLQYPHGKPFPTFS